jgi:hypothetical protein
MINNDLTGSVADPNGQYFKDSNGNRHLDEGEFVFNIFEIPALGDDFIEICGEFSNQVQHCKFLQYR